ncbi:hypothetical protein ACFVTE_18475 [Arthrobacter sp. NPDC058097]|uniref:hypothetical protein n=1 Tax=Arthrobacter sp. NPDC058097 TaxID=3346340 RepID=UPI0036D84A8B
MNRRHTDRVGKPSAASTASFALSLSALFVTSLVAIVWIPVDQDVLSRADAAGWDTRMLLPHQTELTLLIYASVLATAIVVVATFIGLMASRRGPSFLRQ